MASGKDNFPLWKDLQRNLGICLHSAEPLLLWILQTEQVNCYRNDICLLGGNYATVSVIRFP
jgi:hypothetical protein